MKQSHTPLYFGGTPCVWNRIFIRSSGDVAVRDTAPAMPPASRCQNWLALDETYTVAITSTIAEKARTHYFENDKGRDEGAEVAEKANIAQMCSLQKKENNCIGNKCKKEGGK